MEKLSYSVPLPDSYVHFGKHRVFDKLFNKFYGEDLPRLWSLILNCKQVLQEEVQGDFVEVGVYKGNSAVVLAEIAKFAGRELYLFDTFEGFDSKDLKKRDKVFEEGDWGDTSISEVKEFIGDAADCCHFESGYFPETLTDKHKENVYSVISIDCDLYKPVKSALEEFYPLLSHGGIFLVHDYSSYFWEGVMNAVDEFCKETGELLVCMPDKSGSAFIRKSKQP